MSWSFWFAAQWRGVSVFVISVAAGMALLWLYHNQLQQGEEKLHELEQALLKTQQQQQQSRQQYTAWQQNKATLQRWKAYIAPAKPEKLEGVLQRWQEEKPERQLQFVLEAIEAPSVWHAAFTRSVVHLQLRFRVQNEEDLSDVWQEKAALPCLAITHDARLSRAAEGGIWVEEDCVCAQY